MCAALMVFNGAFAQKNKGNDVNQVKSGVMKKAGKVWIVKPMESDETMNNGVKVTTGGVVVTSTGATGKLDEGDCISTDGQLVALNEKNVSNIVVKQNKLMWKAEVVNKEVQLSDGSKLLPDGYIKKADGTIVKLKNDQIVSIALN